MCVRRAARDLSIAEEASLSVSAMLFVVLKEGILSSSIPMSAIWRWGRSVGRRAEWYSIASVGQCWKV